MAREKEKEKKAKAMRRRKRKTVFLLHGNKVSVTTQNERQLGKLEEFT
jgi:hypothetical protein